MKRQDTAKRNKGAAGELSPGKRLLLDTCTLGQRTDQPEMGRLLACYPNSSSLETGHSNTYLEFYRAAAHLSAKALCGGGAGCW